jgi:hypothetical protein
MSLPRLEIMHNVKKIMINLAIASGRQSFTEFVNEVYRQVVGIDNKDQSRYWVKTWLDSDPDFNYDTETDSYGYKDYM